jgi:hypothetical protein
VRNAAAEPLHVVVLSVAEDRSVRMIWPPDDRRDNVLRPGQEQRVPVRVGLDRDWHARHRRPMRDRYVAFATFRFADFRPFCSDAPAMAVERGGDGLPTFLGRVLAAEPRRGGDGAGPGFGIAWYDLELRPE